MKKSIRLSSFIATGVLSLAFAFIIASPAHAQVVTGSTGGGICPSGYTCTPILLQPLNCPTGFTCVPNGITTTTGTQTSAGSGGSASTNTCYTWSNYLGIGSRGADVVALQTWLVAQGYDIPLISANRTLKGYFGQTTANAVKELQTAIGQSSTGFVGPLTIAYLNQNSCGTTTGVIVPANQSQPQIASISPTSGGLGTTVTINGSGFTSNDTVEFDQNGRAMAGISGPSLSQVTPNQIVFTLTSLTTANTQSGVYQIRVTPSYSVASAGSNSVSFTLAGSCTSNCGTIVTTSSGGGSVSGTSNDEYTNNYVAHFTKIFNLSNTSSPVTMTLAADNQFVVLVNGVNVASEADDGAFTTTHAVDITSAVHAGSNTLNVTVTNQGASGSTWSTNPAGLVYTITQNGNLVTSSSNADTFSSALGTGNAVPLSYGWVGWPSIPGAQWIWDSDQGVYNHTYPLIPIYSSQYVPTTAVPPTGSSQTSAGQQPAMSGSNTSAQAQPNNRPPVLSSVSGPTSLAAGQKGNWTINATDPQNSALTYAVTWGDTPATCSLNLTGAACAGFADVQFSSTPAFVHTYATAGTYTASFRIVDALGLTGTPNKVTIQVTASASTQQTAASNLPALVRDALLQYFNSR